MNVSEKEWVDQLYDVRCEPDKLLIMITNRRQLLKNKQPENVDALGFSGKAWLEYVLNHEEENYLSDNAFLTISSKIQELIILKAGG